MPLTPPAATMGSGTTRMRPAARVIARAALLAAFVMALLPLMDGQAGASSSGTGGPVILDGTDAGLHGSVVLDGSGEPKATELRSTWIYELKAWETLLAGVPAGYSHNGRVAVVGASPSVATSNNCGAAAGYIAQRVNGGPIGVDYFDGPTAIADFLDGVLAGTQRYQLIQIVEQNWCSNGMDNLDAAEVNSRGPAIAAHVNRGGALFTQSQSYGWLNALFNDVSASTSCSGSTPKLTDAGYAQFPGLTDSDIAAPWHNCFVKSGAAFPLDVLALQDSTHVVILGGGSVDLPTRVAVDVVPAQPRPGEEACATATVTNDAGSAVTGATVTFTVETPGSSTNATGTTDVDGRAMHCYTSNEGGEEVVTAVVTEGEGTGSGFKTITRSNVTLTATPASTNARGETACLTATVATTDGTTTTPMPGSDVTFTIDGVNAATAQVATTDSSGQAQHCYIGVEGGTDVVTARVGNDPADVRSVTLYWSGPQIAIPELTHPSGQAGKVIPMTLTDFDGATTLYVELSVEAGTINVDATSLSLSLLDGYAGLLNQTAIGFSGSLADVGSALASRTTWTAPAEGRDVAFTITVRDHLDPALAGRQADRNATLVSTTPPTVSTQPLDTAGVAGGSVTFTAAGVGHPAPSAQWQVSSDGGTTWSAVPGATSTSYRFSPSSEQDGNRYRCVLTNTAGTVTTTSALLSVTLPTVPAQPGDVIATATTGSVSVEWQPPISDGGSAILHYIVTLQPGGHAAQVPAPTTTATFTGLRSGTEYTATVVAVNGVGASADSPSSPPVQTPTPPPSPQPAPEPLPVEPEIPEGSVPVSMPEGERGSVQVSVPLTSGRVGTIRMDGVEGSGYITIEPRGIASGPTGAGGFGLAFDVHAEGVSFDGAELCLPYDAEAVRDWGVPAEDLVLYHVVDQGWDPITTRVIVEDDMICGQTGSFSPFVIGVDMAPRWAGTDRIETAVAASARRYQPGVPVVVLATGESFADALVGGPVAAALGGPVLLTGSEHVPQSVLDELGRLAPRRILLLGGAAAVSDEVQRTVEEATGLSVERVAGESRYDTAAGASLVGFTGPIDRVYIATGAGFADALSGGAAAAGDGAPVLLVQPDDVPMVTVEALTALRPTEVVLLGGTDAIGPQVADRLADVTGADVTRLAGEDRFATAAAVALATVTDTQAVVFIAAGGDYPDALAGIPPAGQSGAPLLLVAHDRVPQATLDALTVLDPLRFVVLGGEAAVAEEVIDRLRTLLG